MPKTAISLHIFYEDFVEIFARDITQATPTTGPVDVFVTCPTDGISQQALTTFAQIPGVQNVETFICPNRGRNFGPLLIGWGKRLLDYEIFGHFHSKKSLFTGRQQVEWADHIFDSLLRNPNALRNIFIHLAI